MIFLSCTPHPVLPNKMPWFLSFLLHDKQKYEDLEINKKKNPPISTITSQGRLATLLGDDVPNISLSKGNPERQTDEENPFSSKGISKDLNEPIKIIPVTSQPPGPSSDDSDSDSDSEPAKPPIPPRSSK